MHVICAFIVGTYSFGIVTDIGHIYTYITLSHNHNLVFAWIIFQTKTVAFIFFELIFFSIFPIFQKKKKKFSLYQQQQQYIDAWKDAQSHVYHGPNPNYAYATGTYTPNEIHQTAGIYPPNKVKFAFIRSHPSFVKNKSK